VTVYGPAPDGHGFLGVINTAKGGGKNLCLGLLDPTRHLDATRTACGLPLLAEPESALSPDHRWLAVATADENGAFRAGLVDLTTVFDRPVFTAVWKADTMFGWLDPTELLVVYNNERLVYRVGQADPVPFTVTGVPADAHFEPVPVLVA
jgi:hypothetical protein